MVERIVRRRAGWLCVRVLAGAALMGAMLGQGPGAPAGGAAPSFPCISKPSDAREIGFPVRGTIAEMSVKPGDMVKAGDALAQLDARVQSRAVELATIAASDDSQVHLAETTLAYRQEEMKAIETTREKVAGSAAEVRDARFKLETSAIELESARMRQRADKVTLERERARLEEMKIISPITGNVIEVHKRTGETVDQGTPVVTLVNVDPLWVEVNVPTNVAMGIEVGREAAVEWEDVKGIAAMRGKVVYKSPVANGGARTVQLRVELPNPNRIPSGMHGNVRFAEAVAGSAGK